MGIGVFLSGSFLSGCRANWRAALSTVPAAEQLVSDAELIEDLASGLVEQILDRFGLMVEGWNRRQHRRSGECDGLHVPNVDEVQRGFPRNTDQPAPFLAAHICEHGQQL